MGQMEYRVTANLTQAIQGFEKLNNEFGTSYTTIGQLKTRMSEVRKEIDKVGIGSPQKIQSLQNEYSQLDSVVKRFTESAKLSNTVVDQSGKLAQKTRLLNNELAFTIQDGAYAFNDLRMGVLGISNNLPRVAYQMREMAMITGSWGTAIKTAALGLFSFNGVMSLAVGALVAWTALSGRTKNGNNDVEDSFENLKKAVEDYTASLKALNQEELRRIPIMESSTNKVWVAQKVTELYSNVVEKLGGGSGLKSYVLTLLGLADAIERTTKAQKELLGELNIDIFTKYEKQIIDITNATVKYNNEALQKYIIGQGYTVGAIQSTIASLQEAQKLLVYNSVAYKQNIDAIKELNGLLNPPKPKAIEHTNLLSELYKDILDTVTKINQIDKSQSGKPKLIKGGKNPLYSFKDVSFAADEIDKTKTIGGTKSGGVSQEYLLNQIRVSQSEIREAFPIETTLVDAFQGSITDAGRVAFESIFGQANSLLEIFIQNIATSFLSLGSRDIAGGLLNMLTGGAAGASSGVLGFLGLSKASSQPQQININLDGERLAVAMVKSGTYQRVSQLNTSLRQ